MKIKQYRIIKIFKWEFHIKIPDFLNSWEISEDNTIILQEPPNKKDILIITYNKEKK